MWIYSQCHLSLGPASWNQEAYPGTRTRTKNQEPEATQTRRPALCWHRTAILFAIKRSKNQLHLVLSLYHILQIFHTRTCAYVQLGVGGPSSVLTNSMMRRQTNWAPCLCWFLVLVAGSAWFLVLALVPGPISR